MTRLVTIVVLILSALGAPAGADEAKRVEFAAAGVSLVLPEGMEPSGEEGVLAAGADGLRIGWLGFPEPFDGALGALTGRFAAEEGNRETGREAFDLAGRRGAIVRFAGRSEDAPVERMVFVLGDDAETLALFAAWPPERSAEFLEPMRACFRSALVIPRPLVRVKGASISLVVPWRYVPAEDFPGFACAECGASIAVSEIPGPFSEVRAGMTEPKLAAAGMKLVSREDVTVAGGAGLLLRVEIAFGTAVHRKWFLLFGDAKHTVALHGSYPREHEDRVAPGLRRALLTAREGDPPADPLAELPFVVEAAPPLAFATALTGAAMFTVGGRIPLADPGDPLFVVAPSLGGEAPPGDPRAAARRRLLATKEVGDIKATAIEELEVAGLHGVEIVARARLSYGGPPVLLYQLILFRETGYYLLQGRVRENDSEEWLPLFRRTARTFRPR